MVAVAAGLFDRMTVRRAAVEDLEDSGDVEDDRDTERGDSI